MAGSTFKRLEKKMLIDASIVPELQKRLEEFMDPDPYNIGGHPYEICNIYFDTPNDDVVRDSIQKPAYKEKMRLRSYGTPKDDSKVFLEIKRKLDGVGTKRRTTFTMAQAKEYLATFKHPEGLSYTNEQILNEIDYYRHRTLVIPRAYVSYLRNAYQGKEDHEMRVTFDFDILTRRYDLDLQKGRYGDPVLPEGIILLETKFPGAVPLWLCKIFDEFGLSFGTYSKYGVSYKQTKLKQLADSKELTEDQYKQIAEDIAYYGKLF